MASGEGRAPKKLFSSVEAILEETERESDGASSSDASYDSEEEAAFLEGEDPVFDCQDASEVNIDGPETPHPPFLHSGKGEHRGPRDLPALCLVTLILMMKMKNLRPQSTAQRGLTLPKGRPGAGLLHREQ